MDKIKIDMDKMTSISLTEGKNMIMSLPKRFLHEIIIMQNLLKVEPL